MVGVGWAWQGMGGHDGAWWGRGGDGEGPGPDAGFIINAAVVLLTRATFLLWIQAQKRSPASWVRSLIVASQANYSQFLKAHMCNLYRAVSVGFRYLVMVQSGSR